jgi:hypothetical protein
MKKNFFKKLAATLAFAMVVTSVAPAATASAAAGITQKNGSTASTVYVTKSYGLKLGKGVNAKWTSSNKSVATVGLTGGVLKPVAPGKVTITAVSKNTGKSYKKTFTVKQRATSVELGDDLSLAVGDTAQLDAELTPSVSTDVIRYFSDNKEVATVGMTGGKVTAKANGEATITVYAKATTASSNASKMNKVDTIKVQVGTFIQSATQSSVTKLDVLFNTDMKDAKAADFKIVRDDTNQEFAIKEAKVDGKKVTLETYSEINDGATYTVTYGDSSYKFVATNGKIASLAVAPNTITYNKETEIKLLAKDANGVTVKEMKYGSVDSDYDFEIETDNGYTTDSKLVLYKVGDTAKATATFHTYEYDSNGNEVGVIKAEATITAVEESAFTTGNYKYTIDKDTPNWNDFEQNTKIAINDGGREVFVQLKDKNDEEINYAGYYLDSSNDDILVVNDNSSDSALKASIYAVEKTGTAYVLVKNEDNKVVLSLPVTIVAERKDANLTLSESSVKLTNSIEDTALVKLTLKDQFGEDKTVDTDLIDADLTDSPKNAGGNEPYAGIDVDSGKLKFVSKNDEGTLVTGTYKYKVTYDDGLAKTISVIVQAPSSSQSNDTFKLLVSDKTADIVFKDSETKSINIEMKVAQVDGKGVVRKYVGTDVGDVVTFDLKRDGKAVTESAFDVVGGVLTLKALEVPEDSDDPVVKAELGKYVVTVNAKAEVNEKDKTGKLTGSVTLTDSQPGLRVERDTKVDVTSDTFGEVVKNAFKFYYRGNETSVVVQSVEVNGKSGNQIDETAAVGKTYSIKKVTVLVTVDGYAVPFTVTLNKSLNIED